MEQIQRNLLEKAAELARRQRGANLNAKKRSRRIP
jgi:hypothetical protein